MVENAPVRCVQLRRWVGDEPGEIHRDLNGHAQVGLVVDGMLEEENFSSFD